MELWIIFYIMLGHFFADFVCQTEEMATKKSKDMWWLSYHVGVYTTIMSFWTILLVMVIHGFILETSPPSTFFLFSLWCFIFVGHWITDFISSKITSRLWKKGDTHNFFVVIGFDQWLHLVQLLIIYKVVLDGTV
jgi:hypothetical protein